MADLVTPKRSGLGRGLDALLPVREPELAPSDSPLREVSIADIEPNPRQPRQVFEEESIAELAASISQLGILQPLLVRARGAGGYELVAGERRLRAAQRAELATVPVLIVETDDTGSLERALVENIHRQDLDPLEEAAAYRQLLDEGGLTQDALAKRLGRSPQSVSNTLRLLDLPTTVQRLIHDRSITEGHAKALLGLQGHPLQERAAESVVANGMSVRATEDLVRRYRDRFEIDSGPRRIDRARSAIAVETEHRLRDRLQAKVKVEVTKRRRRIVIETTSDEDLARVAAVLMGESAGASATTVTPE